MTMVRLRPAPENLNDPLIAFSQWQFFFGGAAQHGGLTDGDADQHCGTPRFFGTIPPRVASVMSSRADMHLFEGRSCQSGKIQRLRLVMPDSSGDRVPLNRQLGKSPPDVPPAEFIPLNYNAPLPEVAILRLAATPGVGCKERFASQANLAFLLERTKSHPRLAAVKSRPFESWYGWKRRAGFPQTVPWLFATCRVFFSPA